MTFTEIITLIQRRWRFISLIGVASSGLFFLAGQLLIQYEAQTKVLIRPIGNIDTIIQKQGIPGAGLVFSNQIELVQKVGQSYIQLSKQRSLIREAIEKLSWKNEAQETVRRLEFIKQVLRLIVYGRFPSKQTPMDRLIDRTSKRIKSDFIGQSSVIEIKVLNSDAQKAADLANALLDTFVSHSKARTRQALQLFRKRTEIALLNCQSKLKQRQKGLHQIAKQLSLPKYVDINEERNRIEKKLQQLEDENENRRFNRPLLSFQLKHIKKSLSRFPEFRRESFETSHNTLIDTLKKQLFNMQLEKQRVLLDYLKDSMQVRAIDNNIKIVNQKLQDELSAILAKETHKINPNHQNLLQGKFNIETKLEINAATTIEADLQIKAFRKRLRAIESIATDWRGMVNEITDLVDYEKQLLSRLTRISAVKNVSLSEVEILDRAIVPRYPSIRSVPLLFFAILGFLLGALFSMGFLVWKNEIVKTTTVTQKS